MRQLPPRLGDHRRVASPNVGALALLTMLLGSGAPLTGLTAPRDGPDPPCTPDCALADCGDDGCGGSCGDCSDGWECRGGFCACEPACAARECGPDGCEGSCGTCPSDHRCSEAGRCLCVPRCEDAECGPDGCGGTCGACDEPQDRCIDRRCVCQPDCAASRACGDDGCGQSCGACPDEEMCSDGRCVCRPLCEGRSCGPDGCGGSCGSCPGSRTCIDGSCWEPQCEDGMCLVPAGEFLRGCEGGKDDIPSCLKAERPLRTETLPAFRIDEFEVTVRQHRDCVIDGACAPPSKGGAFCNYGREEFFNHPCNCVSWFQAHDYCAWAGKRLCSEAEWEKAARGVDGRPYPWGDAPPDSKLAVASIGTDADKASGSYPVGHLRMGRSPFGAFDMSGNVWEWVEDSFSSSTEKIRRGGSFNDPADLLTTYHRGVATPDYDHYFMGFRCCRNETAQE